MRGDSIVRRKWWWFIPLILAMASTSLAQGLTPMPDGGRLLGAVTADVPGKWVVFAEGFLPVMPTTMDGGKAIFFQGTPGIYGVVFFPSGDGQPSITRVVLEGGSPPDPPDPPDPPGPDPPTPGGKWQMIFFNKAEELFKYPLGQQELLTSLVVRDKLKEEGHSLLRVLDDNALRDGVPSKYSAFVEEAIGKSLPLIVVAPKDGGKVKSFPLPASYDELLTLLEGL
jgi:hypothetical protein